MPEIVLLTVGAVRAATAPLRAIDPVFVGRPDGTAVPAAAVRGADGRLTIWPCPLPSPTGAGEVTADPGHAPGG